MKLVRLLCCILIHLSLLNCTCEAFTTLPKTKLRTSPKRQGYDYSRVTMSKSRGGGGVTIASFTKSLAHQYRLRLVADPNFWHKSITEVILAAGTQFAAEIGRRGRDRMVPESDFVLAGLLTAVAGKYYSMWRVAPTMMTDANKEVDDATTTDKLSSSSLVVPSVPTNAFQTDRPYTLTQRGAAFIVPVPSLFRAGIIASFIGYGLTSLLITSRSLLIPNYQSPTVKVNIISACIYTGGFMATVSNIRYQLLQGIIEPQIIDRFFKRYPLVRAAMIFMVRLANGLLGSSIAIAGMRIFGLQRLR